MPYNKRHEDCTNASGEKAPLSPLRKKMVRGNVGNQKRHLKGHSLPDMQMSLIPERKSWKQSMKFWKNTTMKKSLMRNNQKRKSDAGTKVQNAAIVIIPKQGRVKNGDGKDVSHIGGINGKTVIKDKSDNRGSKTDGPGDRRARGGKSNK